MLKINVVLNVWSRQKTVLGADSIAIPRQRGAIGRSSALQSLQK
jgi:hypothetical protein